jgi:Fic family protein
MQIVSGPYGRENVHYEAPSATRVPDEMARLIGWYNQPRPLRGDLKIPGIARAGIVHLWFEVIHPFDDGNGRVGRAIADHALSQSLGYPTTACLATAIETDKKSYYLQLEQASRDLSDLVAKGISIPLPGGGRTTRYELTTVKPGEFGLRTR